MIVEKTYETCEVHFEEQTKLEQFDLQLSDDIVLYDILVDDNGWRPLQPNHITIDSGANNLPADIAAGSHIIRFDGEQPFATKIMLVGARLDGVQSFEKSLSVQLGTIGMEVQEIPSGAIDGSNMIYEITYQPVEGTVKVIYNGAVQTNGVHYTQSGKQIILTFAPQINDDLLIIYNRSN